jgi:hypothetical protein
VATQHPARQVLARLDELRARVDSDNDAWLTAQAEAELRFYATGELAKDELHREAVFVNVELELLWAHHQGRDASEGSRCSSARSGASRRNAMRR